MSGTERLDMSQLALIDNEGKLAGVTGPQSCKDFVGAALGIAVPKSTKDAPFTMKNLVELAEAGKTGDALAKVKETIKTLRKSHALKVQEHYSLSAVMGAALAADPRFRKNLRSSKDKKGEVNGWNLSIRRETNKGGAAAAQIAALTAKVAQLTAALNAPVLPPTVG